MKIDGKLLRLVWGYFFGAFLPFLGFFATLLGDGDSKGRILLGFLIYFSVVGIAIFGRGSNGRK